jgi:hypothetical protein
LEWSGVEKESEQIEKKRGLRERKEGKERKGGEDGKGD